MIDRPSRMSYALVRISGSVLAIDVLDIERAIPVPPGGLGQVPRRTGALVGVVQLDGQPIPVAGIGEWVKLGTTESTSSADKRIVILRGKAGRLGIHVDALLGVGSTSRERIQRIFREEDPDELFDCVLPSEESGHQSLPLLEADRLLRLANTWCEGHDVSAWSAAQQQKREVRGERARYAVLSAGASGCETLFAVPVTAISEVVAAPVPESKLKIGPRDCGVTTYRGRKVAMVDFAAILGVGTNLDTDWMAVLDHKGQALGLCVVAAKQLLDLWSGEIEPSIDQPLLVGVAVVEQLGRVHVINMDRLFESAPESVICGKEPSKVAAQGDTRSDSAVPYILFEADRRYASPVNGIVEIVPLDDRAEQELNTGTSTMIRWRDRTVRVAGFPSMGANSSGHSKLAVLVETEGAVTGIAIHKLEAWLPARSVKHSSIRIGSIGDVSMVTVPGATDRSSSVVVNLQDLGYLIS